MDKKSLSERDICTKFITPAIQRSGWDLQTQVREEVSYTKARIIVRAKLVTRGKAKRVDYVLAVKSNIPIALIEAKDNTNSVGAGMQQALEYAEALGIPFVLSSNGDAFLFHDRNGTGDQVETSCPSTPSHPRKSCGPDIGPGKAWAPNPSHSSSRTTSTTGAAKGRGAIG